MLIRQTRNSEFAETERLTREAFWNVYSPGCSEHLILHKLRQSPQYVPQLDCVPEHEGKLVAHIAYAEGTLADETGSTRPLLLFGPVSVLPKFQNRGFGGALICNTLEQAKQPDCNGHSTVFDGVAWLSDEPGSRDMCILEAPETEGIYLASIDLSRLRAYRKEEVMGNAYRRVSTYGALLDPAVHEPFVRGKPAKSSKQS